jgi:Uma2 family endonuclease
MSLMSLLSTNKTFKPGTTGWTADDLDDPKIERLWDNGAYEIIDGVLTLMPPAYYDGTLPLSRLRRLIEKHLDAKQIAGDCTNESDLVLAEDRVVRPDLMFMTHAELRKQEEAHAKVQKNETLRYGRILIAPTLLVEGISIGHERHDFTLKRAWYAEARVPNYWVLDPFAQTLLCLVLDGDNYRTDVEGAKADIVRPSLFPGLEIPLGTLWR